MIRKFIPDFSQNDAIALFNYPLQAANTFIKKVSTRKKTKTTGSTFNSEHVFLASTQPLDAVYSYFQTSLHGLTAEEVQSRREIYGENEVVHQKRKSRIALFLRTFINPFIGVLTALAVISLIIDVIMAEPNEREWTGIIIITFMVILSAILRFRQEWKAGEATDSLMRMVTNTCLTERIGQKAKETDIRELVPGDVVYLAAGDMIPADLRIVESKDLFLSQSSLTGESEPIEKFALRDKNRNYNGSVLDLDNICFMGSTVISGSAKGIVFETGGILKPLLYL